MKIVLNKDVSKLGFKGETLEVKAGFFRNFLAPKKLADVLSKGRAKLCEDRKSKMVMKKSQILENAKSVMDKVSGKTVNISAKANDKGVLFASISAIEILSAVEKSFSIRLDPSFLELEPIKELGKSEVSLKIGELKGSLFVNVENAK